MPKFSVKKPFVVLVGVVMLLVLGFVSFTKMTTDFMPNMNMPYMIVITTYPGASPEKVESEVSEVVENSVGTVYGVKKVTSTSSENSSIVSLQFEDDTDMDAAMVKVSSAVNQVELPENAGKPMIMQISMDMMATMMTSVDYKGKSGAELSRFIDEKIIPELERQDGVASVGTSGMVTDSVEVRLDQDKIDDVNEKVLEKTNKSLAKAKKKLDDAQKKLDDGKAKLEEQKSRLESKQDKTSGELAKYSKLMNQAIATKQAQSSELTSLKANQSALQMEKKAYTKNKVVSSYQAISQGIRTVRDSFAEDGAAYKAIYDSAYQQTLAAIVQSQAASLGITDMVTVANVNTYVAKLGTQASALTAQAEKQAEKTA